MARRYYAARRPRQQALGTIADVPDRSALRSTCSAEAARTLSPNQVIVDHAGRRGRRIGRLRIRVVCLHTRSEVGKPPRVLLRIVWYESSTTAPPMFSGGDQLPAPRVPHDDGQGR
jgi:hypothetical protein